MFFSKYFSISDCRKEAGRLAGEIMRGFVVVFQPTIFPYLVGGFFIGLFFGTVPGLTATLAIALLLPFTFGMKTVPSLVTIMGIYMAGIYSGSITGTMINIPGAPAGAMTALEGYPMMLRGEGAKALGHDAFASCIGGVMGAVILMCVAVPVARVALLFQTPDRFSLVLLAVVTVSVVTGGSITKGIVAATIGLMFATVGMDLMIPHARFHFGSARLIEGIKLLPAVIGLFAISEVFRQIEVGWKKLDIVQKIRRRDLIPTLAEIKEIGLKTYIKSALIGNFVGALPGGGASMAAFIAYAEAKRTSKHPEKYGTGILEGIAAAETANNAMCGGALIPLLTFGIPGDAVTAIIFGVLLIQGLIPGGQLITEEIRIIAPMFAALLVSAILCFISMIAFGPYFLRIANLNKSVLYPLIAMIAIIGAYVSGFSMFQVWVALVIGVIAYFLRREGYPIVPMLMGIILGPYLEGYFRRSLILSQSNPAIFVTRPISAALLALAVIFVYVLGVRQPYKVRKLETKTAN